MYSKLNELRQIESSCDCVFVSGSQRFPFHRSVVCAASEVLKDHLDGYERDCKEIQDVWTSDSKIFETMLDFVYSGILKTENDDLETLLEYFKLNEKLKLKNFDVQIANKMRKSMTISNVSKYFQIAEKYNNAFLSEECLQLMSNHFDVIVKRRHHLDYDYRTLKILLGVEIFTRDPLIVLECITSWMEHWQQLGEHKNKDDKDPSFETLLEFLPLANLTGDELLKITTNRFVYESPQISKMVRECVKEYFDEKEDEINRSSARNYMRGSSNEKFIYIFSAPDYKGYLYQLDSKNTYLKKTTDKKINYTSDDGIVKTSLNTSYESTDRLKYVYLLRCFSMNESCKAIQKFTNQGKHIAIRIGDETFETTKYLEDEMRIYAVKGSHYKFHTRFPVPVTHFALAAARKVIYVIGGKTMGKMDETNFNFNLPSSWMQGYDTSTHTWDSNLAQLPKPMSDIAAITFEKKIYIFGNGTSEVYYYDIEENAWFKAPDAKTSRKNPFLFLNADEIILLAGLKNHPNQIEVYNPKYPAKSRFISFEIQVGKHLDLTTAYALYIDIQVSFCFSLCFLLYNLNGIKTTSISEGRGWIIRQCFYIFLKKSNLFYTDMGKRRRKAETNDMVFRKKQR